MTQMQPMAEPDEEEQQEPESVSAAAQSAQNPDAQPEVEFRLKFQGLLNEVDASTLGYSLVNVTAIVKEISGELDARIDIKVKATSPGSFVVTLSLEALKDPLFQAALASAAPVGLKVIKTLVELFKLRKLLKGDPPSSIHVEGDYYEIHMGGNDSLRIEKPTYKAYFNNPKVNEALSRTFSALESDPYIEGFEIADAQDQGLFEAPRRDFSAMRLTTSVPQPDKREITDETRVHVVKPSFDPKLKWTVLYKGIRIEVSMRDKEFQGWVERGGSFAKGDILSVTLVIHQKLEPALNTYVNKSYEIILVNAHIPRAEQRELWGQRTTENRLIKE